MHESKGANSVITGFLAITIKSVLYFGFEFEK